MVPPVDQVFAILMSGDVVDEPSKEWGWHGGYFPRDAAGDSSPNKFTPVNDPKKRGWSWINVEATVWYAGRERADPYLVIAETRLSVRPLILRSRALVNITEGLTGGCDHWWE
jgi:hypothetical protein